MVSCSQLWSDVVTVVTTGATGARVSMVTGIVVGALVLPAASVAVMAKLFTPSGNAEVGVADHVPSGWTVAVAIT